MNKKSVLLILIFVTFNVCQLYSQGYNEDKSSLTNFIKRMYNTSPFEGVKIIDDYDHNYFISVVSLEKSKYSNPSTLNRVAQVKARQQANTFFNGANITSELLVKTTEIKEGAKSTTAVEMIESIKESSMGFVEGMELLINFDTEQGKRMVFIYFREIKGKEK
ncbi:MAG: hypothetical protein WCP85_09785 [Mariniphaga sp.]